MLTYKITPNKNNILRLNSKQQSTTQSIYTMNQAHSNKFYKKAFKSKKTHLVTSKLLVKLLELI